jgi:hypothetical protein
VAFFFACDLSDRSAGWRDLANWIWTTVIDICGGSHNIVANWIWSHAVEAKTGAPHNRQVCIMELLEKIRIA